MAEPMTDREEIARTLYETTPTRENIPAKDDAWRVLPWDEIKAKWPDRAARAYREALAILSRRPEGEANPSPVQDGLEEVTPAMQTAGSKRYEELSGKGYSVVTICDSIYRAMLAARPKEAGR